MAALMITRRRLLAAGAVVAGGLAGVLVGLFRPVRHTTPLPPVVPPAVLTDALTRELTLVASLERAAMAASPASVAVSSARLDHLAHADALRAELAKVPGYLPPSDTSASTATSPSATSTSAPPPTSAASSSTSTPPASPPPTVAALRSAERSAADAAAAASSTSTGELAALFASISACEATHAELFA